MKRVRVAALLVFLAPFAAGCGNVEPPPPTGKPFVPPSELDQMKNQMIEQHKKGEVGKTPAPGG